MIVSLLIFKRGFPSGKAPHDKGFLYCMSRHKSDITNNCTTAILIKVNSLQNFTSEQIYFCRMTSWA